MMKTVNFSLHKKKVLLYRNFYFKELCRMSSDIPTAYGSVETPPMGLTRKKETGN